MKKTLTILVTILFLGYFAQAQVNPHALGLRFGGNGDINGAELSYQHGLSDVNRLELDFGFGQNKIHNRFFVTGVYQWVWNITGGLNWYIGPGASLGFYSYDGETSYMNVGIGGQIGIEYDFNKHAVPLLLSLDARPMWDFLGSHAGLGWGSSLSLRYVW